MSLPIVLKVRCVMKRKAIDVYVVLVLNAFNNAKVSQESYPSLTAAQEFCKGRGDAPKQVSEYCFKSLVYTYQIYSTTLVLELKEVSDV